MWPLRDPVLAHCETNCFWERCATWVAMTTESGTVTSMITASGGETTNIITRTPTTVSTDDSSWLIVCCSDMATLSMSLVTRLRSSPRGCRSKNCSGKRLEHCALHDVVEQVTLDPTKESRRDVETQGQNQDTAQRVEVNALARDDVHPREQVGQVAVARRPGHRDHLGFREPSRQPLADGAREYEVG